jgi:hypothetical protein
MPAEKPLSIDSKAKLWIFYGIPVVFIIGGLTHFVYGWSGESTLVGILSPVNESVWEHLKITFWAYLIWWVLGYLLLSKRAGVSPAAWFSACAASLYVCALFITAFYYTYTQALGTHSVIVDILSVPAGLAISQTLAYHLIIHVRFRKSCLTYSLIAVAVLMAAFVVFTFNPPHIPLFIDHNTGGYGLPG